MKRLIIIFLLLLMGTVGTAQKGHAYSNVGFSFSFHDALEPYGSWVHVSAYGSGLAAIHNWTLDLYRLRSDVGYTGTLWLGNISLRTLDFYRSVRLGLDSWIRILSIARHMGVWR
jgi:hypothetical protein